MFVIGFFVLLLVFLNSLFVGGEPEPKETTAIVVLDISNMQKGEIRKTLLGGKEVAVLYRKKPVSYLNPVTDSAKLLSETLISASRSQKEDYFVYFNHGDSGNCPLFYSDSTFKDVCSSKLFDTSGREISDPKHGYKIKIPSHHFNNNKIYFGR